ncbi:MAG TPA: AI-2E family transporter [Lysobacter sp.]
MVLLVLGLYLARSILAPVAFAVVTIAIAWPLQRTLQRRVPRVVAMAITVVATACVIFFLASLVLWGFNRAAQWVLGNAARFHAHYQMVEAWLESHGLYLASELAHHFDSRWLLAAIQRIGYGAQQIATFTVITFVFVVLGLLEVEPTRDKLLRTHGAEVVAACRFTAEKFQRYMTIRTVMSLATGASVWALASAFGVELALEWGVLAFALNFVPFLGPMIATLFPTLFTAVQFGSVPMTLGMFVGLNIVQFLLGSYLEPRIAGDRLSLSPFMVLFSVFLWSFLWGVPGAFIGVPILIALITFANLHPSTRVFAQLLAGERAERDRRPAQE